MSFFGEHTNNFVLLLLDSIIIDIFSLRRDDFTVSGLLRRVRGEIPQLYPPRLPSTANSTRELSRLDRIFFYLFRKISSKCLSLFDVAIRWTAHKLQDIQ